MLKCFATAMLLALGYLFFYITQLTYLDFVSQISTIIHKPSVAQIIQNYVSENRFVFLKIAVRLIIIIYAIVYFLYLNKASTVENKIFSFLYQIFEDAKKIFSSKHADTLVFRLCLLFLILHSAFYMYTWAIQYDECWSYNYFLNKNVWFSFLTPNNNHNGFTFLAWFSIKLPIPVIISFRLVALGFGILSLYAFRHFSSMLFSEKMHAASLLFYTASLPLLYYSVIARGYSATVFCFILGLICLQKIITINVALRKIWGYLAFTQALGMFFNPIHFYAAFTIYVGVFLLKKNRRFTNFFFSIVICILFTLVFLGAPLFLLNGYKPLLSVVSQHLPFRYALINAPEMLMYYFSGLHQIGFVWIVICAFLGYIYFKTKNKFALFSILALCIPVIACGLQKQILFERIFTYLAPIMAISLCWIISVFTQQKNILKFVASIFLLSSLYFFRQHFLFNWNTPIDKTVQKTAALLLKNNVDSVYVFDNYAKPGLEFYYQQANKKLNIQMHSAASIDYAPFDSSKIYEAILTTDADTQHFINTVKLEMGAEMQVHLPIKKN